MAWLAVDKDGNEYVFESKPEKGYHNWHVWEEIDRDIVELPKGSIEKLIGKKLTWEDEPLKI